MQNDSNRLMTVCLSHNDLPEYAECADLAVEAWQKAIPTANVLVSRVSGGRESAARAKLARYQLAASQPDYTLCMIQDVDLLPLQRTYSVNCLTVFMATYLSDMERHTLATFGSELYTGDDAGKWPATYQLALSQTWRVLMRELATHMRWTPVFDQKEDPIGETFSDESLLRALCYLARDSVSVVHFSRGFDIVRDRADRSRMSQLSLDRLHNGEYVDCHVPRPISRYSGWMAPIIEYIRGAKWK